MLKVFKNLIESLVFAFKSVTVNRLRTLLSLLGITIGIFAIISVFTVIDSLEINIRQSLAGLGSNVIYVQKWPWAPEEGKEYEWWQYWNRPVPKYSEYEALRNQCVKASRVAFFAFANRMVKYRNNSIQSTTIFGCTPEFEEIRDLDIIKGRFFTPFEFFSGRNNAIIGYTVAEKLFENRNPVGEQIKIMGHRITVIGVTKKEGSNMFGGGSLDEVIVVPINFLRTMIDIRNDQANPEIWVEARPNVSNDELKDDIRRILRSQRRLKPIADDNFALNEASMIMGPLKQVFGVINLAGFFIGIFSILVGGFGIANIMFVSVKERTNIIGIQKALGAKKYFILSQFLFESVMLALSGGIVGLLLVFGLTSAMTAVLNGFIVTLTAGNIVLGLTVSAAIGVISGLAPAWTAARMDPVVAINTTF